MKTRLVLWGTDAKDERVLVAIALNAEENNVDIWTFPEQVATETLYNRLINEWRMGKEVPFPQVFVQVQRPLTTTGSILPDDIKVERPDLVSRAQTEWHFVVLSSRLYDSYRSELEHLKGRIAELDSFDKALWEELKGFWEKVQEQIRDKNMFREHARQIRDDVNEQFNALRKLRKQLDEEFRNISKENASRLQEKLQDIEERIEKGLGLQPLFEELKRLQKEYRDTKLTKEDRSRIWNRLDKAFKDIKERKYGPGYKKDFTALERLKRRYDGLLAAIERMERGLRQDRKESEFQAKKIERSEGQLESQIRQAKLNALMERIRSKEEKHSNMLKTKAELEERMELEKKKEEQRKAKEELKNVKESVKEKIADEIRSAAESREDIAEDLKKAADAITGEKQAGDIKTGEKKVSEESMIAAAGEVIGESLRDVADTVKAVAEVVSQQIVESVQEARAADQEE